MDIAEASNLERFVYDLVGRDPRLVQSLWQRLASDGEFDLSKTPFWNRVPEFGIVSGTSTRADRIAVIRQIYERYGVEVDPHTAAGLSVGLHHRKPGTPLIVHETALPIKFEETMMEALGHAPDRPAQFAGIENRPQHLTVLPPDVEQVKAYIQHAVA